MGSTKTAFRLVAWWLGVQSAAFWSELMDAGVKLAYSLNLRLIKIGQATIIQAEISLLKEPIIMQTETLLQEPIIM